MILKPAQATDDRSALREAEVRMKACLDNMVFRSQFLEKQLEVHLNLENNKRLKQEWVDGVGFKYYLNLDRFRNTPGYTEIALTPEQYTQITESLTELKSLKIAYDEDSKSRTLDHERISNHLKKAAQLVKTNQSLLVQ